MAVTITDTRSIWSECDSTSGWSGSAVSQITSDPSPIEATACLGNIVSNETEHSYYAGSSTNFTDTLIYIWAQLNGTMDTLANGGYRIVIGDGTNRTAYYMGGSDQAGFRSQTGPVAWQCFLLDGSSLPTGKAQVSGTEQTWSTATELGMGFKTLSKALGGSENCFTDIIRYGAGGLVITGGGSGTEGNFTEIATADRGTGNQQAYGIVRQLAEGAVGVQGALTFGDASGSGSVDFESEGEVVIFEKPPAGIANDRFWIKVVNNATGTASFVAIGTNFICPAGVGASWDSTDADVDVVNLDTCVVKGFEQGVSFSSDATNAPNHDIEDCTFSGCGQIDPGKTVFQNNLISESTAGSTGALLFDSGTSTSFTGLSFVSAGTGHAIYITQTGTYTLTNCTYSGYGTSTNAEVYNNSGGSVTLSIVGGDTPNYRNGTGASTTISADVTVTLTGLVNPTEVRVYNQGTTTEIDGSENVTTGSWGFTTSASTAVDIRIFATSYEPADILNYTVPTSNTSIPVQQRFDRTYTNP